MNFFFENFFEKQSPQKTIFFKKIKFLFIGIKNFCLPKNNVFVKSKCPLNFPFSKMRVFGFALPRYNRDMRTSPHPHGTIKFNLKPCNRLILLSHVEKFEIRKFSLLFMSSCGRRKK